MPVKEAYPRLSQDVSQEELLTYYTLDESDTTLLRKARGDANRFGLAVMLKTFQHLGYFLDRLREVPSAIIPHLSQQLSLSPDILRSYDDAHAVKRHRHRDMIRRHLGFQPYQPAQHDPPLRQFLLQGAAKEAQFPQDLLSTAVAWLRSQKVELPTRQQLMRLLASVLEEADQTLFRTLSMRLPAKTQQQMDHFLQPDQPHNLSPFHLVKVSPGRPSVATLQKEVEKLQTLRGFGI